VRETGAEAMEHKARRRHVPAFGEWNYYSSSSSPEEPQLPHSAAGDSAWWYAAAEPEACSDAWFRYSPPPRRPPAPKKARRPAPANQRKLPARCDYGDGAGNGAVSAPAAEARARAPRAVAAPAKGTARRVVRPVDADLYRVPPPDDAVVSRRPRRVRSGARRDCKRKLMSLFCTIFFLLANHALEFSCCFSALQKRAARSLWMGCLGGFNCVA